MVVVVVVMVSLQEEGVIHCRVQKAIECRYSRLMLMLCGSIAAATPTLPPLLFVSSVQAKSQKWKRETLAHSAVP